MKKVYVAPVAEKIEFCYCDQIVASQDFSNCKFSMTDQAVYPAYCMDNPEWDG